VASRVWPRRRHQAGTSYTAAGSSVRSSSTVPAGRAAAARASRIVKGHPEGFHEGFANLYSDAAEAIAGRRAGVAPDPLALHFPTADDGYRGVAFVEATIASSEAGGAWTPVG